MVVAQEVVVAVLVVQVAAEAAAVVRRAMVAESNPRKSAGPSCAGQAQPFVRSLLRTDERKTREGTDHNKHAHAVRYSSTGTHTRRPKEIERVRVFAIMFEATQMI